MKQYIIKRLFALIPLALGVSFLVFLALNFVPGDPVRIMLGIEATEEMAAQLRTDLGLDRPLLVRYIRWLSRTVRGDLGHSIITGLEVNKELRSRIGVTLQITFFAVLVSLVIALPLGIISAVRQDSWVDLVVRLISLAGISLPGFAIGILLILVTSRRFGWYPPLGFVSIWQEPLKSLQIMFLPVLSLGAGLAASVSRMTRSALLEVLRQDYIRTARSKGLNERTVIYRHALKNALIPILTLVGLQVGYLLGGTVVIEEVFALPGLGRLLLTAINSRDYPVVMACVMFIALVFALVNTIVDISYALAEPRIRYQ